MGDRLLLHELWERIEHHGLEAVLAWARNVNHKLETIVSKLDELNAALDDLAGRVGSIGESVGGLQASVTEELAAIAAAIAALQGGGTVTDAQLQAVIDRVTGLSTSVSNDSGSIIDSTNQIKAETAALAPPVP